MGAKIVFNGAYGGYGIPDEVGKKYNEIAGTNYKSTWDMEDIPRHDKLLVQLVEEYFASGGETDLLITEIKGNRYRIEEYDGWESVVEPDDIDWIEVDQDA